MKIENNPYGKPQPLVPEGNKNNGSGGNFGQTLLDSVNPLQHIPVVSGVYRAASGNSISPIASIAGGALFGGVIGAVVAVANVAVEAATGETIAGNVLDAVTPEKDHNAPTPLVADDGTALLYNALSPDTVKVPAKKDDQIAGNFFTIEKSKEIKTVSLGLDNADKRTQLLRDLDRVTVKL